MRMLQAARQAGKLLMVAHVLPFVPEFAFAAEAIRGGRYGRLLGGHFKRVISQAGLVRRDRRRRPRRAARPSICTSTTRTSSAWSAACRGRCLLRGVVENDAVQYLTTQYLYGAGGPCDFVLQRRRGQKGRPFVHGYEIYLEKATLVFESGTAPLTVLHAGRQGGSSRSCAGGR